MSDWNQTQTQNQYQNESFENDLIKYFLHGLIFAIFLPVFSFMFELMMFFPFISIDFVSSFLLLIGVLVILLPIFFGYLNGELARRIWGYNPKQSVTTWFGQGLLIFFMLPFFGGFYYFLLFFALSLMIFDPTAVLILVVFIFLDAMISGYVGKHVAVEFEGAREGAEELASVSDRHTVCQHCGSRFVLQKTKMDHDGYISCPHCGFRIPGQSGGPGPMDSFDAFNQ